MDQSELVRRRVLFSGYVQGVGFRYTTQSIASRLPVNGFVRNLPDGRVELVAEGVKDDLDRLQQAITDAMRSNVTEVSTAETPATGEFTSFRITF